MPSLKNQVDAVILGRGCDPNHHQADGTCVYSLIATPTSTQISAWTPPDPSYGDQPTDAELDQVTEADAAAAQGELLSATATRLLASDTVAASIVDVLNSILTPENITDQVLASIKSKLE